MNSFTYRAAALALMTLGATALAGPVVAQTGGSMSGPSSTPANSGSMSGGSMSSPSTPAGSNTMSGGAMQGQKNTTTNKKPKPNPNGAMGSPSQSSGAMGSQGSTGTPGH
ncbi:MAG: hypothetical protein ABSC92_03945 [Rhizomicrobium sp.]